MPFEPFSNCPSGIPRGSELSWGSRGLLGSQMWLSVVESDGWVRKKKKTDLDLNF